MTPILDPHSWAIFNNTQVRNEGEGNGSCPLRLVRGHPVNPITGSKLLAGDSERDFTLPAPLPLVWQRVYSSAQRKVGLLGQGWSTPLSDTLHISDGQLTILDAFQRDVTFSLPRVGEALYSLSEKITLERTGERSFELIDANGLRRLFAMLPRAYDSAVLVAMVDANDNRIGITWNARQTPASIQDSAGRVFVLDYIDHRGQLRLGGISIERDALDYEEPTTDVLMQYRYDDLGNLFQVINRAGEVTRQFAYTNHIMVEHAQPGALVSRYEYDEYEWTGKVTRNWVNNGMSWNFRYLNGETLVYDHLGREEHFRFDKRRRFSAMVDALGGETVRHLDNHGNVLGIDAPGGRNISYRYDRRSRLMRVESNGKGTGIVYDTKVDKPALLTDALGATTALRYDERGNLLSATDALSKRTVFEYDQRGLPVTVRDPAGGLRQLAYNRAGQPLSHTDCAGNTSHFSYDVDGKLLCLTDAQGKVSTRSYDAAGRLSTVVHPDGRAETYEYDAAGRLQACIDAAGQRTSYERDVDGKLLKRIDAHGGVLAYRYDAARRLAELSKENGELRRFTYDALDRLSEESGFDGHVKRYRYDAGGLLCAKEELAGGVRTDTRYIRNSVGRVVEKIVACVTGEGSAEQARSRFTYDDLGRVTQAIHADAIVSLEYDALGQLVSEQTESGGETTVRRHAGDALGQPIPAVAEDGCVPASQFGTDPLARMQSLVAGQLVAGEGAPQAQPHNHAYDDIGNLLATDGERASRASGSYDPTVAMLAALQAQPHERCAFDPALAPAASART